MNHNVKYNLTILVYKDEESKDIVAHCIELNVIGVSKDREFDSIQDCIECCIESLLYAVDNNCLEMAYHLAPVNILQMLLNASTSELFLENIFGITSNSAARFTVLIDKDYFE